MLQAIREKAQGWIAWVIVILISVPFALWGVNQYFDGGGDRSVIRIDDREVGQAEFRRAYAEQRRNLQQLMGDQFRPEMIDEGQLREQVLNALVENEVLLTSLIEQGYRVGDAQIVQVIRSEQTFQRDGQFQPALFEQFLRNRGESSDGFAQRLKSALLRGQIESGIVGSGFVVPAGLNRMLGLRAQKREVAYLTVPASRFEEVRPTEGEIARYYSDNKARFVTPEQVKIEYLDLNLDEIARSIQPGDDLLRQRYEEQAEQFGTPEDRKVSHILVAVDENRDDDAALARARMLRQRLVNGEAFEVVARDSSDDPGSSEQGGDLGFIGRGIMDVEFERTAYEVEPGAVSDPVRSPFGYHLIKVTEVREGERTPFAEVREELLAAAQRELAENQFFEQAEQLANAAYENPDTLAVAAEVLGLEVKQSDWFSRAGGTGIAAEERIVSTAFSGDVLEGGNNSEPVDLGGDRLIALRVADRQPEQQLTLEQVRDDIVKRLAAETARRRATETGRELVKRLRDGERLSDVAAAEKFDLVGPRVVTRTEGDLPMAVRRLAFKLRAPEGASPSVGGVILETGDYAVVVLNRVEVPELSADDEERKKLATVIRRAMGQEEVRSLIASRRAKANVTVNRNNL